MSTARAGISTGVWAVGALAPAGIALPILFGVAGGQARKRSWLVAAVAYAVLSWGGLVLTSVSPDDSTGSNIGVWAFLIAWIAGAVHAFAIRGEYKRRLAASPSERALERARAAVAERDEAQRLAREEPDVALQMGVGRPDVRQARHMHVVDVNHASVEALARLPGVDDQLALEIARARDQIDGFQSLEDMGAVLSLDGDLVEDLRDRTVFLPR
jgi:hypothetical protein